MLSSMRSPMPAPTRSSSRPISPRPSRPWTSRSECASRSRMPTRFDYWRRMEFTPEQWQGLAAHARERGLIFLSSAFSVAAVDLLARHRHAGMEDWLGRIRLGRSVASDGGDRRADSVQHRHVQAGRDRRCRRHVPRPRLAVRVAAMHERLSDAARGGWAECDRRAPPRVRLSGGTVGSQRAAFFPAWRRWREARTCSRSMSPSIAACSARTLPPRSPSTS